MSRENAEIVRRSTDAYNRRNVDGMLENWAKDAVLDWSNARSFDAGVYRGHAEIRAFMEEFFASWGEVRIELVYGPIEVEDGLLPGRRMDAPLLVEGEVQVVRAREDQLASMRLAEHCPDEQTRATRPEQVDRRIGVGHASSDVEGLGCAPDQRNIAAVGRTLDQAG